jgi:hypothetical protein
MYLQGRTATQLGYALRSLAASYNGLASERKENLSKVQTVELQRVIKEEKLGFTSFFANDISAVTQAAAASTQILLTQSALSRFASFGNRGGANKNAGQQNQRKPANSNNNNSNNSNQNGQNNKENTNSANRGRGGGRRRNGGRGGRGGRGRGGHNNQGQSKPAPKE